MVRQIVFISRILNDLRNLIVVNMANIWGTNEAPPDNSIHQQTK